MDYIFIDGVAVLSLGYAMTLSYPEDKLAKVFLQVLCFLLFCCNLSTLYCCCVYNSIEVILMTDFLAGAPNIESSWPFKCGITCRCMGNQSLVSGRRPRLYGEPS